MNGRVTGVRAQRGMVRRVVSTLMSCMECNRSWEHGHLYQFGARRPDGKVRWYRGVFCSAACCLAYQPKHPYAYAFRGRVVLNGQRVVDPCFCRPCVPTWLRDVRRVLGTEPLRAYPECVICGYVFDCYWLADDAE